MLGKLFDVKKYVVPKSSSSSKQLPSSSESSSEDGNQGNGCDKQSSNESMRSHHSEERKSILEIAKQEKPDYSKTKKLFNIVKGNKSKDYPQI